MSMRTSNQQVNFKSRLQAQTPLTECGGVSPVEVPP